MDHNIVKRNELLSAKVIKGLASRNMSGYYAATKEEALTQARALIDEGSTVTMGGAMSAVEIGLVDAVKEGPGWSSAKVACPRGVRMPLAGNVSTFRSKCAITSPVACSAPRGPGFSPRHRISADAGLAASWRASLPCVRVEEKSA